MYDGDDILQVIEDSGLLDNEVVNEYLSENSIVSENDIETDISQVINENVEKEINENAENIEYVPISGNNVINYLNSNYVINVSSNTVSSQGIMEKPINDYTVQESLTLMFFIVFIIICFIRFIERRFD